MQVNNSAPAKPPRRRGRPPGPKPRPWHKLKRDLRKAKITLYRVSLEAAVTLPAVSNVLAGRARSRHIVETAKRMLAEQNGGEPRA